MAQDNKPNWFEANRKKIFIGMAIVAVLAFVGLSL